MVYVINELQCSTSSYRIPGSLRPNIELKNVLLHLNTSNCDYIDENCKAGEKLNPPPFYFIILRIDFDLK